MNEIELKPGFINRQFARIAAGDKDAQIEALTKRTAALEAAISTAVELDDFRTARQVLGNAMAGGTFALDALLMEARAKAIEDVAHYAYQDVKIEYDGQKYLRDRAAAIRRGEVE